MPNKVEFINECAAEIMTAAGGGTEIARSTSLIVTPKIKPARPSFKSRWKSFRTKSSRPAVTSDDDEPRPPKDSPMDDFFFMESFSEGGYHQDELSVKICKETIRQTLLESMRHLKGNDSLLLDIENNKFHPLDVKHLESLNLLEKNHILLWSAFITRLDYLELMYNLGADVTFAVQGEGFNALHLSAFSGCVNCVKFLICRGCSFNAVKDSGYTPLHYAVLGNSLATAQYLVSQGCNIADTVLHAAALANAVDCVQFLLQSGVPFTNYDQYGLTPLHIAADRGLFQCLKTMLDFTTADMDVKTNRRKVTALHLAAENGYTRCVQLLIDKGAILNEVNYKGQTALHLAAKAQSVECVEILLKEGANVNFKDVDSRTPLHAAVCKPQHAFPVVELFVRWDADVNVKDRYGYTPLHVAALNESSQCVDFLILSGANVGARTKGGMSALSIINRKTPSSVNAIRNKLDECLSYTEPESGNRELKLKLDFRYIIQNSSCGEIGFLQTLEKEGHREILEHPLCIAFLHLKWEKVRRFYFLRLFLCSIFILFLSTYVLTALAHECYNASRNISTPEPNICLNRSFVGEKLQRNPQFMEMTWYMLVFCTVIEIIRKLYSTPGFSSVRQYFLNISNMIEWFVIASVFAISFIYTGRTYNWQNHVGAFAVLCGWSIMMIMIGQLPLFGTYIAMFTKVQVEFAKLLSAYSCLLFGFTISFCVIFPTEEAFGNPIIGMVKVLAMMTGELDLNSLLIASNNAEKSTHLLQLSAYVTFVLFLIFVTVILMNLLVGIAVHDIEGLHKTAGLSKLVRQTELIYFLELAVFHGYLPKRIMNMLKSSMFVSPQAYRVVLYVRPLNPREKRLPKDVMENALNVVRMRKKSMCDKLQHCETNENESRQKLDIANLTEELKTLKALLVKLVDNTSNKNEQLST